MSVLPLSFCNLPNTRHIIHTHKLSVHQVGQASVAQQLCQGLAAEEFSVLLLRDIL